VSRFALSVEIGRSVHDVFAYLTDVSNLPQWQSSALSADADGPVQLGTCIRERRRFAGREVRTELEVVTYEPPRRFDVESRGGPVSFEIRHALEPRHAGTSLAVDVNVKVGAMLRIAAAGPLKVAEREFRSDFQRLKEVLETES
jgi:carbon monoxide dehydrogenase subunit G